MSLRWLEKLNDANEEVGIPDDFERLQFTSEGEITGTVQWILLKLELEEGVD